MRLEGWEGRLAAVIDEARLRPYELGKHDCFKVARDVLLALTGEDRGAEFQYRTRREALTLIAQHGRTFEEAMSWFFGGPHVCTRQAQRGDIVAIETEDGEKHLGVCLGTNSAFLGPQGLEGVPTLTCLCCWRI